MAGYPLNTPRQDESLRSYHCLRLSPNPCKTKDQSIDDGFKVAITASLDAVAAECLARHTDIAYVIAACGIAGRLGAGYSLVVRSFTL